MNFKLYYQSPSTDEPNKLYISQEYFSIRTIFSERNLQIDFTDGGYLMSDEMNEDEIVFAKSSGLFDKNSQDIFEGDIVQLSDDNIFDQEKGVVKFKNAAFVVEKIISEIDMEDQYLCDYILGGDKTDLEVIGNIFENPELLKNT